MQMKDTALRRRPHGAAAASALATLAALAAGCTQPPVFQQRVSADLVVVATTDIHGHARGWDYYTDTPDSLRGLSRVATIVDSLRRVSSTMPIVVDAGDMIEGNPLAYVAAKVDTSLPNPTIAAMNVVQYDAATIGNHDFNYGLAYLDEAASQARFPLLAANVYNTDGRLRYRSWALSTRQGIRIAIIGATTPGSMVWDRDNLSGRVVIKDIIPEVRAAVREARGAAADVIIVSIHSGLNEPSSYDTTGASGAHVGSENVAARLAHEVPGIDLIVYGHSHKSMADTVIAGTLLMQPKNWAEDVAIAHLQLVRRNNRWIVERRHSNLLPAAHHRENSQVLAVTQAAHRAALQYVNTTIGTTAVAWRADSARVVDTPLADFILEVERSVAGTQLSSTAVFDRKASLGPGPITVARVAALYPYDNTLRAIRITGAQLRAYLEQSAEYFALNEDGTVGVNPRIPGFNYDIVKGVDYTIDVTKPVGQRITQLDYDGRAVMPADTFTMALNNYRQTGGGGFAMLHDAPVVYDRDQDIRQLLIDEVRRRGTLAPADYFHPNWRIVPASAIRGLLKHP